MILFGSFSAQGLGVDPASPVTGFQIFHPGGFAPVMVITGILGTLDQIANSDGDAFDLIEASGLDILGTTYDDVLEGGIGPDTLRGGAGNDIYYINSVEDRAVDSTGQDYAFVSTPWTMDAGIENLSLLDGAAYAVGNELANVMTGNSLANAFAGMGGDDYLRGYSGDDLLVGGPGADHLEGMDGNDTLQGGPAVDWLEGGIGNDTYVVGAEDLVTASGNSAYVIGMNHFVLSGVTVLEFLPGTITIDVRDWSGDGAPDTLTINYADANFRNWSFIFSTRFIGRPLEVGTFEGTVPWGVPFGGNPEMSVSGNGNSAIVGSFRIEDLSFGSGNTIDRLLISFAQFWGAGNAAGRIAINQTPYTDFGDRVVEYPGEGVDTVSSSVSIKLPITLENLTLTGPALGGMGNELGNFIQGNELANTLSGMGGADNIAGYGGDDWIEGDSGNSPLAIGQTVGGDIISGGDGNDTILGGAGDDQIHGDAGNDLIVGESGGDIVYGDDGDDLINGDSGGDVIYGGHGRDIVFGSFDGDSIFGDGGDDILMGEGGLGDDTLGSLDVVYGEDGNDLIAGYGGDDWLFGGPGADVMDGGYGSDMMVAGPGADIMLGSGPSAYGAANTGSDLFVYTSMADAGDQIWGFDTRLGDTDGIDLRPLFDALGYTGTTPRAAGFMTVTSGATPADAVVFIDTNGGGDSYSPLLTLYGVSAAALTDAFFLFQ